MQAISSLASELKPHLPWHQSRIICFAQLVLGVLQARSSNLVRIAEEFQSPALTDSSYKRIKRFLALYEFCYFQFGRLILYWLPQSSYTLCLDRTNWLHGQKDINILVLSIAWQGASVPLLWECLSKRGCSNSRERIALMEQCLKLLPADKIDCLLADREFVGKQWLRWLTERNIRFRVRIKNNTRVVGNCGRSVPVCRLFSHLGVNCQETWMSKRTVGDLKLHLAAHRSVKGLLIVASPASPECMIEDYYRRWGIEVLFANLKSRGFDLESTRVSEPDRLKKLVAVLAIATLWSLRVGEWKYGDSAELPLSRHYRPDKSLFRLGLDLIRRLLKNHCLKNKGGITQLLTVLSPT